jgi:hypothetical protein
MSEQKPSPNHDFLSEKPLKKAKKTDEINGFEDQGLLEPTRYGDWDVKGRCSDF